jgi:hypothetical protein
VVRGLAPAWPLFGTAVAGLFHRATMDMPGTLLPPATPLYSILSIYSSFAYWILPMCMMLLLLFVLAMLAGYFACAY